MNQSEKRLEEQTEAQPFIRFGEGMALGAGSCLLFVLTVAGALVIGEHLWGYPYKALQTPALMDKYR